MAASADDLEWLRLEFSLSEADMARIRPLHAAYLPKCRDYCARIEESKQGLHRLMASNLTDKAGIEKNLIEIGLFRAQCQAAMLEHFREVSEAMPAAQGKRYLEEMQRLTLGFHERFEQSMSSAASNSHGHH